MYGEMFTVGLISLPSPSHSRCLGIRIYGSYRFPMGKELEGEYMKIIKVQGSHKTSRSKGYLTDISFEVAEIGRCIALIYFNGCWKATLLDCLLGDKLV